MRACNDQRANALCKNSKYGNRSIYIYIYCVLYLVLRINLNCKTCKHLNICAHATFSSPDLKPSVCCACLLCHECHVIHVCCLSGRQHPVDIFAVLLWRRLERQVCIALNHNTRCHHEYLRHRKICKECRCKTIRAQKKPLCPVCRIQTLFQFVTIQKLNSLCQNRQNLVTADIRKEYEGPRSRLVFVIPSIIVCELSQLPLIASSSQLSQGRGRRFQRRDCKHECPARKHHM